MNLTDAAIKQVIKLVDKDKDAIALRIEVVTGGCSGNQYKFSYGTEMAFDLILVSYNGANIMTDTDSFDLLEDATLDYVENLIGSEFVISNPNATGCCGCGKSFN